MVMDTAEGINLNHAITIIDLFSAKLQRFEIPQKLLLCSEMWTPDKELVTEALKLKRKNIQRFYQQDIEKMYA